MKLIAHIIGAVMINALALWAAGALLPNFQLTPGLVGILAVAGVFTVLNFLIRPILKFVLMPFIIVTLGLGLLFINAFILYLLDFLTKDLSIQGVPTLIYATLIVGVVNFVFHLFTK